VDSEPFAHATTAAAADKAASSEARRLKRIAERSTNKTCFACREVGHSAKLCPSLRPDADGDTKNKTTVGICYRCASLTPSTSLFRMGRLMRGLVMTGVAPGNTPLRGVASRRSPTTLCLSRRVSCARGAAISQVRVQKIMAGVCTRMGARANYAEKRRILRRTARSAK
jgi:Zinc knuckle